MRCGAQICQKSEETDGDRSPADMFMLGYHIKVDEVSGSLLIYFFKFIFLFMLPFCITCR